MGYLVMSALCWLEDHWLSCTCWWSIVSGGICQRPFPLGADWRSSKWKYFWNHLVPLIGCFCVFCFFVQGRRESEFLGHHYLAVNVAFPCYGRFWERLVFWRAFSKYWMDVFCYCVTPSSTRLLIFTSELWNATSTSYCQELETLILMSRKAASAATRWVKDENYQA